MLSTIVVATDGSEAAHRMIACLGGLRGVGSRKAVLTHVFNVREVGGLYESLKAGMAPHLEQERAYLAGEGFDVSIEMPLGTPFYEINRVAEQSDASLIVVGSFGESLISEMLLGSTAHAVLQHAERPVLLIRIAITEGGEPGERCRVVCDNLFGHILFLTDFSDSADRAFLFLEHIAREAAPAISLLHVQDSTKLDPHLSHRLEEFNRIDDDRLERMRLRLQGLGASKVSAEVAYGKPKEVILDRARVAGRTLIVMGSHGRGILQAVVFGSVAHHLARLAPLPILFVPGVR